MDTDGGAPFTMVATEFSVTSASGVAVSPLQASFFRVAGAACAAVNGKNTSDTLGFELSLFMSITPETYYLRNVHRGVRAHYVITSGPELGP